MMGSESSFEEISAVINMQVDIGFGDIITPQPQVINYPTILDLPAPQIKGYSQETVIAEKLETMIKKGLANSRMKDFFDVWALIKRFEVDDDALTKAIIATFTQRRTPIKVLPECFSEEFSAHPIKNAQWDAFIRKNQLDLAPGSLSQITEFLKKFFSPILEGIKKTN